MPLTLVINFLLRISPRIFIEILKKESYTGYSGARGKLIREKNSESENFLANFLSGITYIYITHTACGAQTVLFKGTVG